MVAVCVYDATVVGDFAGSRLTNDRVMLPAASTGYDEDNTRILDQAVRVSPCKPMAVKFDSTERCGARNEFFEATRWMLILVLELLLG